MELTLKYILVGCLAMSVACTGNKLDIGAKGVSAPDRSPDLSTTPECPGGLRATLSLQNSNATVSTGQSARFQVAANGCLYGYLIYPHGSSNPLFFRDTVTYSKSFASPATGVSESVEIVTLDKNLQPASHHTLTTQGRFDVVAGGGLSCSVEPRVYQLGIPLDSNRQPVSNVPPTLTFTVKSNAASSVKEVIPPSPSDFEVASYSPAGGNATSHVATGSLKVLRSGSYEFILEDGAGARARCASDLIINYVSPGNVGTQTSLPQYYFRADVTGDGLDDVVARDLITGKIIVAVANPDGSFSQRDFGSLPPEEIYVNPLFADFNSDGKYDILLQVSRTGHWLMLYSNGSRFISVDLGPWPQGSVVLTNLTVGDPNNDGKPDIIGISNGQNYVAYLTLTATGGSVAAPVLQPPVLTTFLSPMSVPYNGVSQFAWESENTASCRLKANGTLVSLPAGNQQDGFYVASGLKADTAFVLECLRAGTTATWVSASAMVVTVQPPPAPSLALYVKESADDGAPDARVVEPNGAVQLRWATQNVTSCRMLQGATVLGSALSSPYRASNPLAGATDFKLSCVSVTGATTDSPSQRVSIIAELSYAAASPMNFGTVNFGAESATQKITLRNLAGRVPAADVTVELPNGFVYGGGTCVNAANTAFSIGPTATADKTCDYLVKFQPVADDAEQEEKIYEPADVRVTYHNGKQTIQTVAARVTGTGAKPAASK